MIKLQGEVRALFVLWAEVILIVIVKSGIFRFVQIWPARNQGTFIITQLGAKCKA
jgi:hypothetical protein